jgi:hypothetical protein
MGSKEETYTDEECALILEKGPVRPGRKSGNDRSFLDDDCTPGKQRFLRHGESS